MKTILLFMVAMLLQTTCLQADATTELLSSRYSGYDYDTSRPVSHDILKVILQAGRLAPSSYNEQPWHFIVCNRATNPAAYKKVLSALEESNQEWAKDAPVLVVCVADTKSAHANQNHWAQYDTGAAAFGMMIQATSLGLMAHQMGGFNSDQISKSFHIPVQFEPMAVMAIGYATVVQNHPDKKRKPLQDNFFDGAWGRGFR